MRSLLLGVPTIPKQTKIKISQTVINAWKKITYSKVTGKGRWGGISLWGEAP
jgi:hypothetical protein